MAVRPRFLVLIQLLSCAVYGSIKKADWLANRVFFCSVNRRFRREISEAEQRESRLPMMALQGLSLIDQSTGSTARVDLAVLGLMQVVAAQQEDDNLMQVVRVQEAAFRVVILLDQFVREFHVATMNFVGEVLLKSRSLPIRTRVLVRTGVAEVAYFAHRMGVSLGGHRTSDAVVAVVELFSLIFSTTYSLSSQKTLHFGPRYHAAFTRLRKLVVKCMDQRLFDASELPVLRRTGMDGFMDSPELAQIVNQMDGTRLPVQDVVDWGQDRLSEAYDDLLTLAAQSSLVSRKSSLLEALNRIRASVVHQANILAGPGYLREALYALVPVSHANPELTDSLRSEFYRAVLLAMKASMDCLERITGVQKILIDLFTPILAHCTNGVVDFSWVSTGLSDFRVNLVKASVALRRLVASAADAARIQILVQDIKFLEALGKPFRSDF